MSCIKKNFVCLGQRFCPVNQITMYNTGSNMRVVFVSRVFAFQAIFEEIINLVNSISTLFIMRNNFLCIAKNNYCFSSS